MLIDCHTHLGRNTNISASVVELLLSMDKAKIDKALVFAGRVGGITNEDLLTQIEHYKDRLYGVAAYIPNNKFLNNIKEWYAEKRIVGVKFYTGYDYYYPHEATKSLATLETIGCPAIFHCGDCLCSVKTAKLKYAHPLNVDEVAVDYPNMNFIIAHVGNPWIIDTAEVCYKNSNVYTDVSGFVYGKFTTSDRAKFCKMISQFLEISSRDKLLFGTDWPISDQSSYVEIVNSSMGNNIFLKSITQELSDNVKKVFKL